MDEFLSTLQSLFTFAFVVSSMLAMGLPLAAEFGKRAPAGARAADQHPAEP